MGTILCYRHLMKTIILSIVGAVAVVTLSSCGQPSPYKQIDDRLTEAEERLDRIQMSGDRKAIKEYSRARREVKEARSVAERELQLEAQRQAAIKREREEAKQKKPDNIEKTNTEQPKRKFWKRSA